MDSPDDYNYHPAWQTLGDSTAEIINVRADSDAHVYLADTWGVATDTAYEIVISGFDNTR